MNKFNSLIKLGIVAGLLYLIVKNGFISVEATQKAFSNWPYMISAFTLLLMSQFLGMYRWKHLLHVQQIELPFGTVAGLSFIGVFFNIALPGAVSGDIVKAHYVGKVAPGKRAKGFSSIFFDRVIGVSALVLVSAFALALSQLQGWSHSIPASLQAFVYGLGISVFLGFTYLFLVHEQMDPFLKVLRMLEAKSSKFGSLTRIYEGLKEYQNHRRPVFLMLAVSMVIHACTLSAYVLYCYALGETQLPALGLFVLMPLAMIVTVIPIAPGGLGTGHAAFLFLLRIMGSDRGADLFNLILLFQIALGMIGAIIYLRFKAQDPSIASIRVA